MILNHSEIEEIHRLVNLLYMETCYFTSYLTES